MSALTTGTITKQILIPGNFQEKVAKLNSLSPFNEWAGILFFIIEKNQIILKDVMPTVFSQGYAFSTNSNDFRDDLVDYQIQNNLFDCNMGLIHSHCELDVFFSGPDNSELFSNCGDDWYLSVITNNSLQFTAKYVKKISCQNEIKKQFVLDGKTMVSIKTENTVELFEQPLTIVVDPFTNTYTNEYARFFTNKQKSKTSGNTSGARPKNSYWTGHY